MKNFKKILKTKLCKNKSVVLKFGGQVYGSIMMSALFTWSV